MTTLDDHVGPPQLLQTGSPGSTAQPTIDPVLDRSRRELAEARARIEHLQIALQTNRRIGMAIGILMADQKLTADEAFDRLRTASQHSGRKLRDIAEDVIYTGAMPAAADAAEAESACR